MTVTLVKNTFAADPTEDLIIKSGDGNGTGDGGVLNISASDANGAGGIGGDIILKTGMSTSAVPGKISFVTNGITYIWPSTPPDSNDMILAVSGVSGNVVDLEWRVSPVQPKQYFFATCSYTSFSAPGLYLPFENQVQARGITVSNTTINLQPNRLYMIYLCICATEVNDQFQIALANTANGDRISAARVQLYRASSTSNEAGGNSMCILYDTTTPAPLTVGVILDSTSGDLLIRDTSNIAITEV